MKKVLRLFLCLFIGLYPAAIQGQELLFGLTNRTRSSSMPIDSIALYAMLDRTYKIQKRQPGLALQYYHSALEKCSDGAMAKHKAKVYSYIASCYADQKDYYKSIDFMQLSVEDYLRQGLHPFKQFFSLSGLYGQVGAYQQAVAIYHSALSMAPLNAADTHYLRRMMCNVAFAYSQMGMEDSASVAYYKVIATAKVSDTSYDPLLSAYTGLANTSMRLQQWDKAWKFLDKAYQLSVKQGDSIQIMGMMANKGTICYQQKNYAKAKAYHYPALAYARYKKNPDLIFKSAHILGAILSKEYQFKEAQAYAKEAYDCAGLTGSTSDWLTSSYLMGCVHTHTGQYSIALKYLEPAVKYAEDYHLFSNIGDGYDHLSTINEGLGHYKKALYYKQRQFKLYDSMMGKENAGRIAEVEMKYKTAEKDKLIARKELLLIRQQSRIREKNIWIGVLSIGGFLLSIIIIGLYTRKQQREKLHQARIINMGKDREIIALKAKMEGEEEERARLARDLHDGVVVKFSAVKMNLSILPEQHSSLENATDFQKIIHRLDEATTELRSTAHNLLPDTLLEGGLTEAIHYFCKDIQQSSGLTIDIQQYTDIPRFQPGFELSVYRIVQELVQNVLKHADASRMLIQIVYHDMLSITVEDNGKGFDTTEGNTSGGIGMKNLRSRIASLQGFIDIRSKPGEGTSVYMEFTPPLAND